MRFRRGGGNFNPENRRITEILGVEYYDGYDGFQGKQYSRHCRHRFFYDDEGRLDRWTNTEGSYNHDLEFYYESDSRISIFGTKTNSSSGEISVCYELELDAAGRVIQIRDGDGTTWSYTYSGDLLSERRYSGSNSEYTSSYTWTNGDLTRIEYDPVSSSNSTFQKNEYGNVPNIANLDLNYLTDLMDSTDDPEDMLRIAGMQGRNAHFVTRNFRNYIYKWEGVIISEGFHTVDIEWSFDEAGYPTGWKSLAWDPAAPEKDSGWEYTIYYE